MFCPFGSMFLFDMVPQRPLDSSYETTCFGEKIMSIWLQCVIARNSSYPCVSVLLFGPTASFLPRLSKSFLLHFFNVNSLRHNGNYTYLRCHFQTCTCYDKVVSRLFNNKENMDIWNLLFEKPLISVIALFNCAVT